MKRSIVCFFVFIVFFQTFLILSNNVAGPRDIPITGFYEGMAFSYIDGNYFAADGHHYISLMKEDGTIELKIGGPGTGPGEIMRLSWFALHPKTGEVYTVEQYGGNKRISRFNKNGEHKGELEFQADSVDWSSFSHIAFDSRGNAYIQANRLFLSGKYKEADIISEENAIFKFDEHTKKADKIYSFTYKHSADKWEHGNVEIPFAGSLRWLIADDRIIIREPHNGHIKIYSLNGDILNKAGLPFEAEAVFEDDIKAWARMLMSNPIISSTDFWTSNTPIPEQKPVNGGELIYDGAGTIITRNFSNREWAFIDLSTLNIEVRQLRGSLIYATERDFYFLTRNDEGAPVIRIINRDQS